MIITLTITSLDGTKHPYMGTIDMEELTQDGITVIYEDILIEIREK